ncbi:SDR family oxidoreductase [Bdellovibrio bacteriovorus]|uniref:Putative oxidoreductase n=1 Tax=Bdellovibrio bacteriovorus str. Tiberius TaxID=1069642 RepID=K7YXX6_BDEBC|nr:SDR family oxidoreductase [Bdellovibrio bacteriovorus]AFY02518.1 putative oxidoreductase [Bdellovibrio bacteriovorus str. Tiberius]
MSNKKVWFITGAGRGMGIDIGKAALAAGYSVVATGRDIKQVEEALGKSENLLVVALDVTKQSDANAAVEKAVSRFGRIDVLVNNAGNFYAGYFEDLSQADIERQMNTNFYGPLNVTRAVLPVLRKQKSGHIITISSTAGLVGIEFGSAYAASKFAVEGWMLSLQSEVAQFGINTTIVNPGFFRTDLLSKKSMTFGSNPQAAYKEKREQMETGWSGMAGTQGGDPKKLANALIEIARQTIPPKRFMAGADAVATSKQVAAELLAQTAAFEELSSSLALDNKK